MGLIDFINKHRGKRENKIIAKFINGHTPIFTQFGQDIYASDVVQQAISCIVTEMKKLSPQHINKNNGDSIPQNSKLQKILLYPNNLMTMSDFL